MDERGAGERRAGPIAYSLVDGASLLNGSSYTYFAVATYEDEIQSDPSNLVTIAAVNEPPAADDDTYSTDEDTPLVQAAPGVLDGDADPDSSSTFTADLVTGPSHGMLTLNADGSFTYTPEVNYYGPDSFTYRAFDGTVYTNIATVTLTVNPVNDAPAAGADGYGAAEDTALNVAAPGVLGNDTDVDGTLTAVVITGPSHGTLLLNSDGSFSYTPAANYSGSDSFIYRVSDGLLDSSPATVNIVVTPANDAPVAGNDGYTTAEDTPLNLGAPGVLGNDTDIDSALTAVLVTGPSHGTLALNANGSFTYAPALNYYGPDAFTYKAYDGTVYTDTATVSITIASVNDAPTISNITDRSIDVNGTTGAVNVTISDDDLATVAVSGVPATPRSCPTRTSCSGQRPTAPSP